MRSIFIKRFLMPLGLALAPSFAFADWAGESTITYLSIKSSGDMHVSLESFKPSEGGVNCAKDIFVLPNDAPGFSARSNALLFVYASGSPVSISYYGCHGDYYALSSVTMKR